MKWKVSITGKQLAKLLKGEGVNLKYFQIINGTTTIDLDYTQCQRLTTSLRRQRGFYLRLSASEIEQHQLHGDGIFDALRTGVSRFLAGPSDHESPAVRNILKSDPSSVVQAWLFRTPLNLIIKFILLYLSDSKFDDKRKELNANDVYHTGFIFTLANGKTFRVEKNAVVEVTPYHPQGKEEVMQIGLARHIPMEEWIHNAQSKHGADPFQYTPGMNNCSKFCEQMLGANPISSTSLGSALTFVHQESEQLFTTLSQAGQTLGNAGTNIAGRIDRVIQGEGVRRQVL